MSEIHARGPITCGFASVDDFDYNYVSRTHIATQHNDTTDRTGRPTTALCASIAVALPPAHSILVRSLCWLVSVAASTWTAPTPLR